MSAATHLDHPAHGFPPRPTTPPPSPLARVIGSEVDAEIVPGVTASTPLPASVEIVPWSDPTFEVSGHDPRSAYVERYWLGLLGPSTTWLLRRFARGLDECPSGFRIDLAETGLALGLGDSVARSSTTHRSVIRACQFGAAYRVSVNRLAVRSHLPTLTRRQVARLPEPLQRSHERWARGVVPEDEVDRAGAVAGSLRAIGESAGEVERYLRVYGFPNAVARDATRRAFGW